MFNSEFNAWLHGFLSLAQPQSVTADQIRIIRAHINLCHEVCHGALTVVNSWIHSDMREPWADQFQHLVRLVARDFNRKPLVSGSEVAYFIQGFFEIERSEHTNTLNVSQCKEIIAMMDCNIDGIESTLLDFYWEMRAVVASGDVEARLDSAIIKARVNSLFQHVIDPSYGFTWERSAELQMIHSGVKPQVDKLGIRVEENDGVEIPWCQQSQELIDARTPGIWCGDEGCGHCQEQELLKSK